MKNLFCALTLICIAITARSQALNYYFGNIHSHTSYSDGNKDSATTGIYNPAGSYAYAKLSQNFDFLGIAEHNHYSSASNPGMQVSLYAPGLSQASAATTSTFLALYGMEWGVSTATYSGHVVIYGFNQLIGWETFGWGNNFNIYNAKMDYDSLFIKVKNNPNAFATLAHPSGSDYGNLSNIAYNPVYDAAIYGTVFRNGPAFSTSTTYTDFAASDYFWYYKKMLSKGYHLGITYDGDNHYTTFGRANAGRLVVMSPTLTSPAFYTAMQKMHFYASDDWNCKIDFKIGSNIMGDSLTGTVKPTINVTHNDMDGELADSIKVWAGVTGSGFYPTVVSVVKSLNTLLYTDNTMAVGANKYYFIEVVQADGDRIISSPIWYHLSSTTGIQEYKDNFTFLMFPNPVRSMLYVSTSLNEKYKVEIFDVRGKQIFEEEYDSQNISIPTEKFAAGFYSVKISNNKFSKIEKLIIE